MTLVCLVYLSTLPRYLKYLPLWSLLCCLFGSPLPALVTSYFSPNENLTCLEPSVPQLAQPTVVRSYE